MDKTIDELKVEHFDKIREIRKFREGIAQFEAAITELARQAAEIERAVERKENPTGTEQENEPPDAAPRQ